MGWKCWAGAKGPEGQGEGEAAFALSNAGGEGLALEGLGTT